MVLIGFISSGWHQSGSLGVFRYGLRTAHCGDRKVKTIPHIFTIHLLHPPPCWFPAPAVSLAIPHLFTRWLISVDLGHMACGTWAGPAAQVGFRPSPFRRLAFSVTPHLAIPAPTRAGKKNKKRRQMRRLTAGLRLATAKRMVTRLPAMDQRALAGGSRARRLAKVAQHGERGLRFAPALCAAWKAAAKKRGRWLACWLPAITVVLLLPVGA